MMALVDNINLTTDNITVPHKKPPGNEQIHQDTDDFQYWNKSDLTKNSFKKQCSPKPLIKN